MTNQASDSAMKKIPEAPGGGPRKEERFLRHCSPYMGQMLWVPELEAQNINPQALPGRPHLFRVPCKTKKRVNPHLLYLALDTNEG